MIHEGVQLPHRNLVGPLEIGAYLNWLREESRRLVIAGSASLPESGPKVFKSLKRALSWFLAVGETGAVARIVALLSSPPITAISRAARARELERLLDSLAGAKADALKSAAGYRAIDAGLSHDELNAVYEDAAEIARSLVEEMDRLQSLVEDPNP